LATISFFYITKDGDAYFLHLYDTTYEI